MAFATELKRNLAYGTTIIGLVVVLVAGGSPHEPTHLATTQGLTQGVAGRTVSPVNVWAHAQYKDRKVQGPTMTRMTVAPHDFEMPPELAATSSLTVASPSNIVANGFHVMVASAILSIPFLLGRISSRRHSYLPMSSIGLGTKTMAMAATTGDFELAVDLSDIPDRIDAEAEPVEPFAIPPETLIRLAKNVLVKNIGVDDPSILADEFLFVAPYVGPFDKEKFLSIFGGFKLKDAFPDLKENVFGFTVDPLQPNRVWHISRTVGTNTAPFAGMMEPTGTRVELPPTVSSMLFNERGQCTKLTTGYVADKEVGNTGGMALIFGILYALGRPLPFPEAKPWQPSLQYRFATWLGSLVPARKE